jgi:diacylglycerol kinase
MAPHQVQKHFRSYGYAAKGVRYTFRTQVNIWVHMAATILVLLLAVYLDFTLEQYIILILTIGLVLSAELFNTAIEVLIDLISPEYQAKAGLVKDVAAGAVLVAATAAAIIGIVLFTYAFWIKFGLTGVHFSDLVNTI